MKKICFLLCLLTVAGIFAACSARPAHSGTFYDYTSSAVGTFNMYNSSDSTAYELSRRCTARLYTMLPREDGEGFYYAPDLAENAPEQVDDTGTVFKIRIRDGYRWQNGEEIGADDFIYSMQTLLSPEEVNRQASILSSSAYAKIKNASSYFCGECSFDEVGVKKSGEREITLITENKCTPELIMRTFDMSYTMLVYKPLYEKCRNEDGTSSYGTSLDSFMSAGPFVLTSWEPDAKWEFTVNPDYVYSDRYSLEKIVTTVIPDENTAAELFLSGKLDHLELSYNQWDSFADDPRVINYYNNSLQYMFINLGNPSQNGLLGNINFRRALYYGADRVSLSEMIGAIPATRIVRKSVIGDPDTGKAFVDMPGSDSYVDDGYTVYNPALANQYLDRALEECSQSSASLEIYFGETQTHARAASEIMQAQYQKVFGGKLSVTLRSVPASMQFNLRRWNENDPTAFEANIGSLTPSAMAPHYTFQYYTSAYNPPRFKYSNPVFDEIYAEAESTSDPSRETELCQRLEKILLDDLVVIPLYEIPSKALFSDRVKLPVRGAVTGFGFGIEFAKTDE